jgi:hypothetical protein
MVYKLHPTIHGRQEKIYIYIYEVITSVPGVVSQIYWDIDEHEPH